MKGTILFVSMNLASQAAWAQVGHVPAASPYRDLPYRQEISLSAGYLFGSNDPAGVAPGGGPMMTARYELRLGNSVVFGGRVSSAFTERTVVEFPEDGGRLVETRPWPIHFADVGFALSLSGSKSYRNLVPVVGLYGGLASDVGTGEDESGFGVGTQLGVTFDAGVRWYRGGSLQLRANVASQWYQLRYPASYLSPPDEGPPLLELGSPQRVWSRNLSLSLGVAYVFLR